MKRNKIVLSIIVILILAFALSGCNNPQCNVKSAETWVNGTGGTSTYTLCTNGYWSLEDFYGGTPTFITVGKIGSPYTATFDYTDPNAVWVRHYDGRVQ